MNSSIYKILNDWASLVDNEKNKNSNVYKKELLVEKYKEKKVYFSGDTVALPLARRVAATTLGQELVSVQPLSQPTGILFYMDYEYERENVYKRIVLVEKMVKARGVRRRSRRGGNRRAPINFEVIDNANGRYIR